jgi:hypothetical protein
MAKSSDVKIVEELVARLKKDARLYPSAKPHPRASALKLPSGELAHESLRAWAALDDRYPTPNSERRSNVKIAKPNGELIVKPMKAVFQWACVDSIKEEIEDDEDTLTYVKELAADLTKRFPGSGVLLDPDEQPDRILWLRAKGAPLLLWYEDDDVERQEPFGEWVRDIFAHDSAD